MSQAITSNQITAIQTIISKQGLRDHKEDIVLEYTRGREKSVSGLRFTEAKALIAHLKAQTGSNTKSAADIMRNKILSQAHELGWEHTKGKIDMGRVNEWCIKYGHKHCRLDLYQDDDLPMLVSQFEKMYIQYIEKA